MARLPRLVIPNQVHHVVQSGIDNRTIFADTEDYTFFLDQLKAASKQYAVAIHAYTLLPNRLLLLATPTDTLGLGRMMQWLGRCYVPYFNAKYKRAGLLWQGRFKATVLEATTYYFPCSVMIEEMPVREGLAGGAAAYPWSSCQHHLGLRTDAFVVDHPMIWDLGNTPFQREARYKELMELGVSSKNYDAIQHATSKAWLLGSDQYKVEMAKLTTRRVEPAPRGRPRKIAA